MDYEREMNLEELKAELRSNNAKLIIKSIEMDIILAAIELRNYAEELEAKSCVSVTHNGHKII